MTPPALHDARFWLLLASGLCLAVALLVPTIGLRRPSFNIIAVIDITGSMNTRDQAIGGKPASRLDFVKQTLRQALAMLPCQSHVAVALFTERRSFLLSEPVEICENFAAIDGTLARLDWRMAWEGDSYIASGLSHALTLADSLDADLLFLTDGQEAPPPPENWEERFEPGSGRSKGLIAGVGGYVPSPIPKFDPTGREVGFYNVDDVPHETRVGGPPKDAESREGWHPRNAPYGAAARQGNEHLSSVREDHLKVLGSKTGLAYAHLESAEGLAEALMTAAVPRPVRVLRDISALPAALALALLIAAYLPGPPALAARLRSLASLTSRKGIKT
ncbi:MULTISPECIES: vWA domain-containing protein [Rhodomicrobium]|uniref:vWA domain-containing protein n=1 Tax=Rhodomicrobium TaxID=1068 RepID=UPI000B4B4B3F|nr:MULTISPECIES: vWA domain-containing protein [Rhodomicrobium]